MRIDESQLESFITDSGLASKEEMEKAKEAAREKGVSVGSVLVSRGVLNEDDLRRMQAYILGIPFVDLKNQKLDFSVLSLIPEPIARNHNIVAFKKSADSLEVAMLDTEDLTAIDFIKKKVGLKILPRLTDDESMKWALLSYQKTLKAEFGDIIGKLASELKVASNKMGDDDGATPEALKRLAEDIPVVRIVDTLLKHAIIQDASGIHIEPEEGQVLVRYRIDGILRDAMVLPKNIASGITARVKILANLKLDEKRIPQDGRFKLNAEGEKVSFRVSTLPVSYGEKIVMRVMRESVSGFTLESLGLRDDNLEELYKVLSLREGFIIIGGEARSGKTTTLYTLLDILNTPRVSIGTIEDPIEYQMPRVNQTQVRPEIGFTFANGLRALVRQDPDIIMIGEINNDETATLAASAAHSGRLVLATMAASSPAQIISRFKEMKVSPTLLASSLKLVLVQKLLEDPHPARGQYELLKITPAVRELILNKVSLEELENVLRAIPE